MSIKVLIIDNDINKIDNIIKSFNLGSGSVVKHKSRPNEAVDLLYDEYFDIIFLDFFLLENDTESAFRVLNAAYDKDTHNHGIVFLISQMPGVIQGNPDWMRKLKGYSVIEKIFDYNNIQNVGSKENKEVQLWIDTIKRVVNHHSNISNHGIIGNNKTIVTKFLKIIPVTFLVYLAIEFFLPYLRHHFPDLSSPYLLSLLFVGPLTVFIILYWAEIIQLVKLLLKFKNS